MRLVRARLARVKTEDGLAEVMPHVKVGKEYWIDIESARAVGAFNTELNVLHTKKIVNVYDHGEFAGYMYLELLDYDEKAA
jgi:hypothetical protein